MSKPRVEIDDAVGEEIVVEDLAVAQRQHLDRNRVDLLVQIRQLQRWQCRQQFGRIGRLLQTLERCGVVDDGLQFGLVHQRPRSVETRTLLVLQSPVVVRVRLHHHGGAMGVVEQIGANQRLEIGRIVGQPLLDRGQRRFEGQRGQRILIVEPGRQRAHHQQQATRIGAGVVLAQAELDGVERGFDHLRLEALVGQVGQACPGSALPTRPHRPRPCP